MGEGDVQQCPPAVREGTVSSPEGIEDHSKERTEGKVPAAGATFMHLRQSRGMEGPMERPKVRARGQDWATKGMQASQCNRKPLVGSRVGWGQGARLELQPLDMRTT